MKYAVSYILTALAISFTDASGSIQNGGFETGNFSGWTVSGNVSVQKYIAAQEGTYFCAFNDAQRTPNGTVRQAVATTYGTPYTLTFFQGAEAYNQAVSQKIKVTVTGNATLVSQTFTASVTASPGPAAKWVQRSIAFTANSATTTITFVDDPSNPTYNTDLLLDRVVLTVAPTPTPTPAGTRVTSQGEAFYINGAVTFKGGKLNGLLPNTRMVNATFDDANPATVNNWRYPDTGVWDPLRQTNEFVAALPSYRAKGLLAVTLNFQGGNPITGASSQPWNNTGFNSDGSLKSAYLNRMDKCIRALAQNGMVAIVGYFYFGQDERLADETAVRNAATKATQWILNQGYTNVLIEISNECDATDGTGSAWIHPILKPSRITELIAAVQNQSANAGHKLMVGESFLGGKIPTDTVLRTEDFILLHGNNQNSTTITSMINTVRSKGLNKPMVFNEDSTSTTNFSAATNNHASWGYYDGGANNYVDGFQSPPTNWRINTIAKQNFFNTLSNYAGTTP